MQNQSIQIFMLSRSTFKIKKNSLLTVDQFLILFQRYFGFKKMQM